MRRRIEAALAQTVPGSLLANRLLISAEVGMDFMFKKSAREAPLKLTSFDLQAILQDSGGFWIKFICQHCR